MAKQKTKTEVKATTGTSKRAGYKRKSNKRVDVLGAQLKRLARKAVNRASYLSKEERAEAAKARAK